MFEDEYIDSYWEGQTEIEPTDEYDGQPDDLQENQDFAHDDDPQADAADII